MGRYVEGHDRTQSVLFPERLDDWIDEDSTVRVIDVFVDELDLRKLGFERADPAATGRPGYSPATLLKIYVYGYLNRVQSSRRLETEAQRNLELIWLTGRLAPDFKTIADFRRDNGEAIRKVCKEFVLLCRRMKLFTDGVVAIDGSKFKAVNNRDKNFTDRKLQARIEQLEDSIKRYLVELDRADRDATAVLPGRVAHLKDKIAKVKQQMQALEAIGEQMKASEDGQISLTDPDARSMATSGRGTGIVGYNVQTAVDAKHHLIVAHEVTNVGHDRDQLAGMAKLAKAAAGEDELIALADRGYYEGYALGCGRCRSQAHDLEQPGRRSLRQAGLRLRRQERRVPVPRWQDRHLPLHDRGSGQDPAQVLVVRLSAVPDEATVHDGQVPAHRSLGARRHPGGRSTAAGGCPRGHEAAKTDCRACVRNAEVLDGIEPLPDQDLAEGANRDELAGSGLQPQAGDQDPRRRAADGGDEGVGRRPFTQELNALGDRARR
jgi:transposase